MTAAIKQRVATTMTALTVAVNTGTITAAVAGNLIVITLAGDKNTGTLSVSDNISGTTGWTVEVSVPGASVSNYVAWKTAAGGETTITATTSTASTTGNSGFAWELEDTAGTAAWAVVAKSAPAYSDTAVGTRSTGTTGTTTYAGLGIATCSVDSQNTMTGTLSWTNSYTAGPVPTQPAGSGGGNAANYHATKSIAAGATTEATFATTAGTDQMNAALVVFGRQISAGPTAPTASAGADVSGHPINTAFTRTATASDGGSAITGWTWTLVSGPAGGGTAGSTIGTAAALSWTPSVVGTYVLGVTATNAVGTSARDDMTIVVVTPTRTLDAVQLGVDAIAIKTSSSVGGEQARIAFAATSAMTTPTYSGALQTPTATGASKHAIPAALAAGGSFWYQVELGGVLIDSPQQFRKLPAPYVAASFDLGFSSCRDHTNDRPSTNPTALADAVTRGIHLWLMLGDPHYRDITTNDQALFRAARDELFTRSNIAALYRSTSTAEIPSDHDTGGDNTDGTDVALPAYQAVYRERIPHTTLPSATGVYHTFVVGRVRFVMLDTRSFRSPNANTDNSSKTMLGAAQKTWLQGLLDNADTPLTVIASDVGWVGAAEPAQDHWGNYQTERAEVGGWITAAATANRTRCVVLAGDAHMLAYDDGTNSVAGVPVYHGAALNQTTSTKGGPYSGGSRASTNAYGYVSVADTGSQIDFTYTGVYDGGTLWSSHTTTVVTAQDRTPNDTVGITDTATDTSAATRPSIDAVGLVDSAAAAQTAVRTAVDAVGLTDSTTRLSAASATVTDPVGITDAAAATVTASRAVADLLGLVDSTTTATITAVLDTVGVSDSAAAATAAVRAVVDPIAATDLAAATAALAATVIDPVAVADATATSAQATATVLDPVAIGDTVTSVATHTRQVADPITVTDSTTVDATGALTAALADTVGTTDTATAAVASTRASTDTVGTVDAVTVSQAAERDVADTVALADTATTGGGISVDLVDAVGLVDTTTPAVGHSRGVTDTVAATDAAAHVLEAARAVIDGVDLTDLADAGGDRTAAIDDPVGLADFATWSTTIQWTLADSITVGDLVTAGATAITPPTGPIRAGQPTQSGLRVGPPGQSGLRAGPPTTPGRLRAGRPVAAATIHAGTPRPA